MLDDAVVHLVEDDEAVRDAVGFLLRSAGRKVEAYANAEDFLSRYQPRPVPECLVVDIRLPGMTGLDLQETLHSRGLDLPIIVVTGHGDVPVATRAMKAGAADFIQKPLDDALLLASVDDALDRARARIGEKRQVAEVLARCRSLTPRERDVMRLVVSGASNKVAAGSLGISSRTVEIYRRRVMEKMQAKSLPELVRLIVSANVTD